MPILAPAAPAASQRLRLPLPGEQEPRTRQVKLAPDACLVALPPQHGSSPVQAEQPDHGDQGLRQEQATQTGHAQQPPQQTSTESSYLPIAADPGDVGARHAETLPIGSVLAFGEVKVPDKLVDPGGKPLPLVDMYNTAVEAHEANQQCSPLHNSVLHIILQLLTYFVVTQAEFGWLSCWRFTWLAWCEAASCD